MVFESESELRRVALPGLYEELAQERSEIIEEFSYSAGRTDLVFTYVSQEYLRRRLKELDIGIPIEDKSRLKAFLRIHNRQREITKDYYYEISSGRDSETKNHLNWLIDNNFVQEFGDGKIRSTKYLRKHITNSIAVELKLDKWQRALEQAIKARSFADYQYVAMDEDYVSRVDVELFRDYGVGLIGVSRDGTISIYPRAQKNVPFSKLNAWRLNEATFPSVSA